MKFPDSSKSTFSEVCAELDFSNSRSAANLPPNVIVSSRNGDSGTSCASVILVILSSYFLISFPVRNVNSRICRSGNDCTANLSPSREKVRDAGTDFDFLKSYRSVLDLKSNTSMGFTKSPLGCQYSIIPPVSTDTTQS